MLHEHLDRDGLKGWPVLLGKSQAGQGKSFSQPYSPSLYKGVDTRQKRQWAFWARKLIINVVLIFCKRQILWLFDGVPYKPYWVLGNCTNAAPFPIPLKSKQQHQVCLPNFITVPDVVVRCARFVEEHGITDGIYRVSGIASNIKRLRSRFIDDDQRSLESLYDEQWIVQVHF